MDPPEVPSAPASSAHPKGPYNCRVCGKPKRGHACSGRWEGDSADADGAAPTAHPMLAEKVPEARIPTPGPPADPQAAPLLDHSTAVSAAVPTAMIVDTQPQTEASASSTPKKRGRPPKLKPSPAPGDAASIAAPPTDPLTSPPPAPLADVATNSSLASTLGDSAPPSLPSAGDAATPTPRKRGRPPKKKPEATLLAQSTANTNPAPQDGISSLGNDLTDSVAAPDSTPGHKVYLCGICRQPKRGHTCTAEPAIPPPSAVPNTGDAGEAAPSSAQGNERLRARSVSRQIVVSSEEEEEEQVSSNENNPIQGTDKGAVKEDKANELSLPKAKRPWGRPRKYPRPEELTAGDQPATGHGTPAADAPKKVYLCSKCGQPKRGHACTAPEEGFVIDESSVSANEGKESKDDRDFDEDKSRRVRKGTRLRKKDEESDSDDDLEDEADFEAEKEAQQGGDDEPLDDLIESETGSAPGSTQGSARKRRRKQKKSSKPKSVSSAMRFRTQLGELLTVPASWFVEKPFIATVLPRDPIAPALLPLFPNWTPLLTAATQPNDHLPTTRTSPPVRIGKLGTTQSVALFDSLMIPEIEGVAVHVGGSVWALDWLEGTDAKDSYLAVAPLQTIEETHRIGRRYEGKSLVQIWRFTLGDNRTPVPALICGVAHDSAFVSDLRWCPYSQYNKDGATHRLGLIAACLGDGRLVVWSVTALAPASASSPTANVRNFVPVFELAAPSHATFTSVRWAPASADCGVLLAGRSDGAVQVWNLRDAHDNRPADLSPIFDSRYHSAPVRALSFSPLAALNELHFASAAFDGSLAVWDAQRPFRPVAVCQLTVPVADLVWRARDSCVVAPEDRCVGSVSTVEDADASFWPAHSAAVTRVDVAPTGGYGRRHFLLQIAEYLSFSLPF